MVTGIIKVVSKHKEKAYTVNTDVITYTELGKPGDLLFKLHSRIRILKFCKKRNRNNKFDYGNNKYPYFQVFQESYQKWPKQVRTIRIPSSGKNVISVRFPENN